MAIAYTPSPSPSQIMRMMAEWVARTEGVKVTVTMEGSIGQSTTIFDGRPKPLDVCTEPEPQTLSQRMRAAGFTRRPTWRSLPSDE